MRNESGASYIVSPMGEITWQSAARLREKLNGLIERGYRTIVVNFADVSFVDSAGLATILAANRRLRSHGGTLMLVNVPDQIMRALNQARLCEIIPTRGERPRSHRIMPEPMSKPTFMRTLSVPCEACRMSETRKIVTELIDGFDLPREEVFDLTLAFGEALGNAFDHGGARSDGACDPGTVTVSVERFCDRVVIEVTDCGCGMRFEQGDALPEASETRGRGIRLMTMLVDSVSIEPKPGGRGTMVRLVKMTDPCNAQQEA